MAEMNEEWTAAPQDGSVVDVKFTQGPPMKARSNRPLNNGRCCQRRWSLSVVTWIFGLPTPALGVDHVCPTWCLSIRFGITSRICRFNHQYRGRLVVSYVAFEGNPF
jgi:hypothetical protein